MGLTGGVGLTGCVDLTGGVGLTGCVGLTGGVGLTRVRKISSHRYSEFLLLFCLCTFFLTSLFLDYPVLCLCLYCTTHTCMPPPAFESAVPASKQPQTVALDRSATAIGRGSISGRSSP